MEHITTGFNSQRWKNHFPKAGQWVAGVWSGVGGRKGIVGMAVRMACMCCLVGDGGFGDGTGGGRWAFNGPESLGPERASLWEWGQLLQ